MVAISGSASARWPHEPEGWTELLDESWDDLPPQFGGKNPNWPATTSPHNDCRDPTIVENPRPDGSGPGDPAPGVSPSKVLQVCYPENFVSGAAPFIFETSWPPTLTRLYVGWEFMYSTKWQGSSATDKMLFVTFGDGSNVTYNLVPYLMGPDNPDGSSDERLYIYFVPNSPASAQVNNCHLAESFGDCPGTINLYGHRRQVTRGQWHRMEMLVEMSTSSTSRDGVIKVWLDGAVAVDYTNVNFYRNPSANDDKIFRFQLSPVWGGQGAKTERTQWAWYDHLHISREPSP